MKKTIAEMKQELGPKKTVKAYKLFRVHPDHPGKLFPLFIGAKKPVEMGKWTPAENIPTSGFADRPGWHAGEHPVATHIGEKSDPKNMVKKPPDRRPHNQAWAEVEMPHDVDWQSEANKRGTNAKGKVIAAKAHITDEIPVGGHYRYKTNPNMTGSWLIGGSLKVNKVLTDDEVERINKKAGVADLPRTKPFNKKEYGFKEGGLVSADERKANLAKMLKSSAVKKRLYHGTKSDIREIDTTKSKRLPGFWMSSDPKVADAYSADGLVNPTAYPAGANIMPVHVQITKPYKFNRKKKEFWQAFDEYLNGDYDGFIDDNNVVVKHPHQVKSAIGNQGTYDTSSPDITKADGGTVKGKAMPSIAQMKMALSRAPDLRNMGVNQAIGTRAYSNPDPKDNGLPPVGGVSDSGGLPVGGVDTDSTVPGQQMTPPAPNQPAQPFPPAQGGMQPPVNPAIKQQPPTMGNMLSMTPQGQTLDALAPAGMPGKKGGGRIAGLKGGGQEPYQDPKTTKIEDWKWRPMSEVGKDAPLIQVPDYIQKGYGEFMVKQLAKAKKGQLSPRDLLKAFTITQSSIGRGGLSHATATKTGMKLPNTGGQVRPEGAFSEWLGSPMGQKYLDAAEKGEIHHEAIKDIQTKFAPFGKHNQLTDQMAYAAHMTPHMASLMNHAVSGSKEDYRDWAEKIKGIAGAKSGFIGSMLGRGDLPTLDARQLNLHALPADVGIGSIMNRGKGKGAREAVDRLASRQQHMNLDIDPSLMPHYQHLTHHAVWDAVGKNKTHHDDIVRAMQHYDKGGSTHYPPSPSLNKQEIDAHAERIARQMAGLENPNNRTLKQLAREKDLEVGIRRNAPKADVPVINFEEHKGSSSVGVPGDPSRGGLVPNKEQRDQRTKISRAKPGETLHSIGGEKMEFPVGMFGGKDYGAYGHDAGWASDLGASAGMFNVVKKLHEENPGSKILGHYHKMTPESLNHAVHMLDAVISHHQPHKQGKERVAILNHLMRNVKTTSNKNDVPYPSFPGFENPADVMLHGAMNSGMRKKIIGILGTEKHFPGGKQKLDDIIHAISHPELRNIETGAGGSSILQFDPSRDLKESLSEHPTYGHDIPSKLIGKTRYLTPAKILAPRSMHNAEQEIKAMGKKVIPFNHAKMSIIREPIDEQYINQMGEYETAMKKRLGYNKGGKVNKDTMKLELSKKKAG